MENFRNTLLITHNIHSCASTIRKHPLLNTAIPSNQTNRGHNESPSELPEELARGGANLTQPGERFKGVVS